MPTPVGHVLAGGTVGLGLARERELRRDAALCALCAVLPDLDFVPGALIGDPSRFHHDFSHSLVLVLGLGLLVGLVVREDRLRRALIAASGYASHLLLDLVTLDALPPYGMALFWPLSDARIHAPISLLPGPDHTGALLSLRNLVVGVIELAVFGALLAVVLRARSKHGARPRPEGGVTEDFPAPTDG